MPLAITDGLLHPPPTADHGTARLAFNAHAQSWRMPHCRAETRERKIRPCMQDDLRFRAGTVPCRMHRYPSAVFIPPKTMPFYAAAKSAKECQRQKPGTRMRADLARGKNEGLIRSKDHRRLDRNTSGGFVVASARPFVLACIQASEA